MLPSSKPCNQTLGIFPPSPLGTKIIGTDQLEWLLQITCASRSLFSSLLTQSQRFIAMGYGLCETSSELHVSICISVRWVVPILVSSCANCDLNVFSNWLSDFLTPPRKVSKRGVKVSSWTCSYNIFCVVRHLIEICCIWSMDCSIWPVLFPLLNVTCLFV